MYKNNFESIHDLLIKSLQFNINIKDSLILKYIGKVYLSYLIKLQENPDESLKINLNIPLFNESILKHSIHYLSNLHHIFILLENSKKYEPSEDDRIFNIINYLQNQNYGFLNFHKIENNVIEWKESENEEVVFTKNEYFLPIYTENRPCENKINIDFKLYTEIKKAAFLNNPIRIPLGETLLISLNQNKNLEYYTNSKSKVVEYSNNINEDDFINLLDSIYDNNLSYNSHLLIKYPYYRFIDQDLGNILDNSFSLNFKNNFYFNPYENVYDQDISPLPIELISNNNPLINPLEYFNIINTNHSEEIFTLISEIFNDWKASNFNKYTHSFPKYFFMFITPEKTKENWITLFNSVYPKVQETGIIHNVKILIELLIKLNWSEQFLKNIQDDTNIVFPDLNNNRNSSICLKEAFTAFKNYCLRKNDKLTFSNSIKENKHNIILESLNILRSINILQKNNKKNYQFFVPDFLYYNTSPFFLYQIYNFQVKAYLNNEEVLNYNPFTEEEKRKINDKNDKLRNYNRQILKDYYLKYSNNNAEKDEEKDEINVNEDLNLDDEEDLSHKISNKKKRKIIEIETKNDKIPMKSNNFLFVYRNNLLYLPINEIEINDLILNENKLNSDLGSEIILNRLRTIPESTRYFTYRLSEINNVFDELRKQGLRISTQAYFENTYIKNERIFNSEEFKIPRKDDWSLICEYLNISDKDRDLTYIAKYRNKNLIKNVFNDVLLYLTQNGNLSRVEFSEVKYEIQNIITKYQTELQSEENEFDISEFTNYLVSNIHNQLLNYFEEVKDIKYINE